MEAMEVADDEATGLWSMFAKEEIQRSLRVRWLETAESHMTWWQSTTQISVKLKKWFESNFPEIWDAVETQTTQISRISFACVIDSWS